MKKHICFILCMTVFFTSLFVSCTKQVSPEGEKESMASEEDTTEAVEPEASEEIGYFKEFLGGTGYVTETAEESHYEYSGGEMEVEFAIHNMGKGFECGVFIDLNGVFQKFAMTALEISPSEHEAVQRLSVTEKKSESPQRIFAEYAALDELSAEYGFMHTIAVPEKEDVFLKLRFTPNTGSVGEVLGLSVGTMTEPSYSSTYSGWPRYARANYHAYGGASGMTVRMNCDSTHISPVKDMRVSKNDISEGYYDLLTASSENEQKAEAWKNSIGFALYYDIYDFEKDVIVVPDTDKVDLKLDIFGKTGIYRISVFINHQLVEPEKGCSYIEAFHTEDKVTQIVFPVDITDIPDNSHIYVIASEYCNDEDSYGYGHFIFTAKTRTCFFIKGELPEVTNADDNTAVENGENQIGHGADTEDMTGSISELQGFEILYVSPLNADTICFVGRDADAKQKALYYDPSSEKITHTISLDETAQYFAVVGETLICADNTTVTDGKCQSFDASGREISSFVYVDNEAAAIEKQGIMAMLSKVLKKTAIDTLNGDLIYLAGGTDAYYIPASGGIRTKLDFFSGANVPTQITNFTDGIILTSVSNDEGSVFCLTDLNGNTIKKYLYPENKNISCAGSFAVIFEQKNASGISSGKEAIVLNCVSGDTSKVIFETNRENQWCMISADGKYVLTYDNDVTFRLYDAETSAMLRSFKVPGVDAPVGSEKVLIDSANKTVYFQTILNESYCVRAEKF